VTPVKRKRLVLWDRTKFLILLAIVWLLLWWSLVSENPLISARDAAQETWQAKWWLEALFAVEVVRQLHYLLSERWSRWHCFWTERFFGGFNRIGFTFRDWTRYRLARALKVVAIVAAVTVVAAAFTDQAPIDAFFDLPSRAYDAMPMVVQVVFYMALMVLQFVALFWFMSRGGVETYFPEDVTTRFSDVWGQDAVVARVKECMVFLDDPASIESRGGHVPGGILLWGPPGTGKTLMAEAVAGETGKPFVFVEPAAFQNMFFGVGVLKVKALFRKLRKLAMRYGGVIVFFDEADSLGNRGGAQSGGAFGRALATPLPCHGADYLSPHAAAAVYQAHVDGIVNAGMSGGGGMGTLEALLSEISGLKKPRGFLNRNVRRALGMRPKPPPKYRILIMMATNLPDALDSALLRPGRIDRIYRVGYPAKPGRVRTYEGYFAKVDHELTDDQIDRLATITPYATGATIKDLVNEALIHALRHGRERITWEDVVRAKQLKQFGPPEDVEYIDRERHATAVHEACHAVAAYRSRFHLEIDVATIEKGGTFLGMVASIKPEDQFTTWRSEYEADVMVSLASLAGERMFFGGDSSSGCSGDLDSATTVATLMEGYFAMGTTIASHGVTYGHGIGGGGGRPGEGKDEKKLLHGALGDRIEEKLAELYARTETLLTEHRREVFALTHALETHKTLSGDDVRAVLDGRPGPLVDGTVYLEPGFLEAAETYHAAVLEAHERHAKVHLPMPASTDWVPPMLTVASTEHTNGEA
jgi:cell division protease FtsH